jgi:hypothetical protein
MNASPLPLDRTRPALLPFAGAGVAFIIAIAGALQALIASGWNTRTPAAVPLGASALHPTRGVGAAF